MTRKIDEVVSKLLPNDCVFDSLGLKNAILNGDLWLPCSVEDIEYELIRSSSEPWTWEMIATAIHTMMKERK